MERPTVSFEIALSFSRLSSWVSLQFDEVEAAASSILRVGP